MSKSALASITAQYTDSENEDDNRNEDSNDSQNSQASQVIIPKQKSPVKRPVPETTEKSAGSNPHISAKKVKKRSKKLRRLVSYQDDTFISDEDYENETDSSGTSESADENSDKSRSHDNAEFDGPSPMEVDDEGTSSGSANEKSRNPMKTEKSQKYAHYAFNLPPAPKGKPSAELLEKIRHLYNKMETSNMDMNRVIQERKEFRNPSIYEKLIQFCDINEFGTNYPPEIYDPLQWGAESYYEELARVQKNDMLKRQKDRKDTDKIEQATALARKVEEEAKKRKSKWDQPAPLKTVLAPALTTTVTGTKGTVISAFGSLPKKPAL